MSLVRVDLAPPRGGRVEFNDIAEAILWTQRQREAWDLKFRQVFSQNANHPMATVLTGWARITDGLHELRKNNISSPTTIDDSPELIAEDSPIATALGWVADYMPTQGITAAATAAGLSNSRINWAEPTQADGVLLYERALRTILESSDTDQTTHLRRVVNELSSSLSNKQEDANLIEKQLTRLFESAKKIEDDTRDRITKIDAEIGSVEFKTNATINDIERNINSVSSVLENAVSEISRRSEQQIADWIAAFKEQRKLESPITLWEERAHNHESALSERKWWLVGIGSIGLLLSFGVAIGAFFLSRLVFEDAMLSDAQGKIVGVEGMRPSFHFELLFSSAATLLYITMYLWVIRLLVRLYSTEHHLAIDARGRSALTETYLSLTREGAASDADRAIMLGVIFRPVSDGMVKEDGPPSVSPAALIAGLASGQTKVS